MDLPQVDTCCFGLVPLKAGTIIAGIVTLIIELTFQGYGVYYAKDWLSTIYAILVVAGIISSILLIVGVYANNRLFVRVYLIAFALLIIFTVVILVLILLRNYNDKVTFIVNTVVYICVVGYCLIVANSYYRTMA